MIRWLAMALYAAGAAETPLLVCPELPSAPMVDGVLSDKAWQGARQIDRFWNTRTGEPAPADSRVLLGRHGPCLCLAASLSFRAGHTIESFSKGDDDPGLWEDDGIEVFLDTNLRGGGFAQIILNSAGQVYDARTSEAGSATTWNLKPRPRVAARIVGSRLHIEAAFDLAALGGQLPKVGDVWGLKLCRTHWDRRARGPKRDHVYTSNMPGSGSYSSRPYARLVFGRVTEATRKALAKTDRKGPAAHPIHRLVEASRTRVWAKPYQKLSLKGRYQSERLIFHDTGTGAEIWRVTFDPYPDGVGYANWFPWNEDGSWLMFGSRERMGGYWHMFVTGDGERITQIPGAALLAHPRWRSGHAEHLLSAAGRSLVSFSIKTGKQEAIAQIPEGVPGRPSFGRYGRWAAICKQGFGQGAVLTALDLHTGETQRIKLRTSSKDFSGDWLYSGRISYVKGVPHVGYSLNHLPHLSRQHQYQQWLMNLQTGEYRSVRFLSHGGTSPLGDRKVGYSGGGVCTTDYFGDDKRFVMSIGTGGHIAWMSSPQWCLAGNSGPPGGSRFSCQLVQIYVDSGNWCRIAHGQTRNTTYGSHLFANTSPDGTKAEYSSTMLGPRDMYWAVMHWPEPPRNLRAGRAGAAVRLAWDRPEISKEYAGARVWRSARSGGPYRLVSGREPIAQFAWTDADSPPRAYYVATSVEHSSLESRRFSNEVAPIEGSEQWPGKLRRYVEAETGESAGAFAVNFHGSASCDRFVEHRRGEGVGSVSFQLDLPRPGPLRVWARARATQKPADLVAKMGRQSSRTAVAGPGWRWAQLALPIEFARGRNVLRLESSGPGLGIDKVLLTDDSDAKPVGFGDTECASPGPVTRLSATAESPHEVRLAWTAPACPSVHHFSIYRLRRPGSPVLQENLIASPWGAGHLDWGLEPGTTFEYAVTAADSFGHESSEARVTVSTPPVERLVIEVEAETGSVEGGERKIVADPEASGGAYVETPPEALNSKYRLTVPFEVQEPGDYVVWASMFPLKDSHIYLRFAVDGKPNALMYMGSQRSGSTKRRLLWRPLGVVSGVTPVSWRLQPGRHRIEILHVGRPGFAGRYHAIDQFVVTNDRSFMPPGPTWGWE